MDNTFFMKVDRNSLPKGLSNFHLSVWSVVDMILRLLRENTHFSPAQSTKAGVYQHNLDNNSTQLIRVSLAKESHYFPEISGGKHHFTARFIQPDNEHHTTPISDEIKFSLSCCSL